MPSAALCTAKALVAADLQGIGSHGVSRVPFYCAHLRHGRVAGNAQATIVRERSAAFLVDAQNGMAFEACELAIGEAVIRARVHGVCYAAITNSNHFGMVSYHLEPVAAAGMVAIAFGNAPASMPAWGGKRALFGTNPIAAIFPRRADRPLMIDLSLSEAAKGKLMVAAREGKPILLGWALDKTGNPTTNPQAGIDGMMLPAGGVKGAMLAMMVEILSVALTGAAFGFETNSFYEPSGTQARIGQGFLVIDPGALAGQDVFFERMEFLVAAMTADEGVRLPGYRRFDSQARLERDGIKLSDALSKELHTLAGAS